MVQSSLFTPPQLEPYVTFLGDATVGHLLKLISCVLCVFTNLKHLSLSTHEPLETQSCGLFHFQSPVQSCFAWR